MTNKREMTKRYHNLKLASLLVLKDPA